MDTLCCQIGGTAQDMKAVWQMQAPTPGKELLLCIGVQHPELGNYFQAILKAKRVTRAVDPEAFTWIMPQKVAFWIYWQVLKSGAFLLTNLAAFLVTCALKVCCFSFLEYRVRFHYVFYRCPTIALVVQTLGVLWSLSCRTKEQHSRRMLIAIDVNAWLR